MKRLVAMLGFATGLAAVLIAGNVLRPGVDSDRAFVVGGPAPVPRGMTPLPNGRAVTMRQAEDQVPYRLYRPNDELASDGRASHVWYQPPPGGGPAVAIEYSSGVQVIVEAEWVGRGGGGPGSDAPPDFDALARSLARQAADYWQVPESDYLAEVKGGTAFIVPHRPGRNTGSIMFSLSDSVRITIYGEADRDTLIRVAESVT